MADRTKASTTGPHGAHDLHLVARFSAGDAGSGEASRARELLAGCPECAALAADLRAIAAASRGLAGASSGGAPGPAPRDFRITPADAQRIRSRGPASWVAALAGMAGLLRARGAAGLVAIGLVGILVGTGVPGTFIGGSGSGGAGGAAVSAQAPEAATSKDLAAPGPAFAPLASGADQLSGTPDPLRVNTVPATAGPAGVPATGAATAPPPGVDATPGTDTTLGAAAAAQPAPDAVGAAGTDAGASVAPEAFTSEAPPAAQPAGSVLLIGASALIVVIGFAFMILGRRSRRTGS